MVKRELFEKVKARIEKVEKNASAEAHLSKVLLQTLKDIKEIKESISERKDTQGSTDTIVEWINEWKKNVVEDKSRLERFYKKHELTKELWEAMAELYGEEWISEINEKLKNINETDPASIIKGIQWTFSSTIKNKDIRDKLFRRILSLDVFETKYLLLNVILDNALSTQGEYRERFVRMLIEDPMWIIPSVQYLSISLNEVFDAMINNEINPVTELKDYLRRTRNNYVIRQFVDAMIKHSGKAIWFVKGDRDLQIAIEREKGAEQELDVEKLNDELKMLKEYGIKEIDYKKDLTALLIAYAITPSNEEIKKAIAKIVVTD